MLPVASSSPSPSYHILVSIQFLSNLLASFGFAFCRGSAARYLARIFPDYMPPRAVHFDIIHLASKGFAPEFLALKHESRMVGHSFNPVCGFSTMEIRLCAVWPMENWLGSPLNQIQGILLSCFRARTYGSLARLASKPCMPGKRNTLRETHTKCEPLIREIGQKL